MTLRTEKDGALTRSLKHAKRYSMRNGHEFTLPGHSVSTLWLLDWPHA